MIHSHVREAASVLGATSDVAGFLICRATVGLMVSLLVTVVHGNCLIEHYQDDGGLMSSLTLI